MLTLLLASIFLNGVNIDGLRGQKFDKCRTVRIDERGDVHLDCPGYQVERPPAAIPASTSPALAPLLPSARSSAARCFMAARSAALKPSAVVVLVEVDMLVLFPSPGDLVTVGRARGSR